MEDCYIILMCYTNKRNLGSSTSLIPQESKCVCFVWIVGKWRTQRIHLKIRPSKYAEWSMWNEVCLPRMLQIEKTFDGTWWHSSQSTHPCNWELPTVFISESLNPLFSWFSWKTLIDLINTTAVCCSGRQGKFEVISVASQKKQRYLEYSLYNANYLILTYRRCWTAIRDNSTLCM